MYVFLARTPGETRSPHLNILPLIPEKFGGWRGRAPSTIGLVPVTNTGGGVEK